MTSPTPALPSPAPREPIAWLQVTLAALLMLATLPGRTLGLGLITEPLLQDLHLDRVLYANLNLWATLLGAGCALPAGTLLDRCGLRWPTTIIVALLGAVVWAMSRQTGSVALLFILILLTRALGQSALSVASITAVGKSTGQRRASLAMGVYTVLLTVFFIFGFLVVGQAVTTHGWRFAWAAVAGALLLGVAPLTALLLRTRPPASALAPDVTSSEGLTLAQALRTPTFWVFGGAIALFGLAYAGLSLFNEAVLAERGFSQAQFHTFLGLTTFGGLIGQFLCGWWAQRWSMGRLLGVAMLLYATGLATLPLLRTSTHLWLFAGLFGVAGGMITVLFFAIWSHVYGRAHLGRIQGAAQMLTVLASALGPLLFAQTHAHFGTYTPILLLLAGLVLVLSAASWWTRTAPFAASIQPPLV